MYVSLQLENYFELLENEMERELDIPTTKEPQSCELINRLKQMTGRLNGDQLHLYSTSALRHAKQRIQADAKSRKWVETKIRRLTHYDTICS